VAENRTDEQAIDAARALLRETAARLAAAAVRDEAVGEYVEPKPVLGVRRDPTMRHLGRAWRIGALLLAADGSVRATGSITRVTEPGRAQFVSRSMEVRRAYRAAAVKGRFEAGETVNHGTVPIPLDASLVDATGPLFVHGGEVLVRWSATAEAAVPLAAYLRDRVALLLDPPQGATD
jgi:hypothetical protein